MAAEPFPGWKAAKKLPSPATQKETPSFCLLYPQDPFTWFADLVPTALPEPRKGWGYQQVSSWGGGLDPARMLPPRKGSALVVGGGWKEGTPPSARPRTSGMHPSSP